MEGVLAMLIVPDSWVGQEDDISLIKFTFLGVFLIILEAFDQ